MNKSEINAALLDYYTALTQHHRTKISILGGAYLSLSQVLLFTPIEKLAKIVAENELVLVGGIACLITLLFIGITHHIGTLSVTAAQRLNIVRNLYFELKNLERAEEVSQRETEYMMWANKYDNLTRDGFSFSRLSALIALVLVLPLYVFTLVRFHTISTNIFSESTAYMFLGAFYCIQALIVVLYGFHIGKRAMQFYRARSAFKIVQNAEDVEELESSLYEKLPNR